MCFKLQSRGFSAAAEFYVLGLTCGLEDYLVTVVWRVLEGRCLKQCAHFFADVLS